MEELRLRAQHVRLPGRQGMQLLRPSLAQRLQEPVQVLPVDLFSQVLQDVGAVGQSSGLV
ncbi:hypothetical protein ACRJ4W_39220 [Streptomyces sp. GLT-R25]